VRSKIKTRHFAGGRHKANIEEPTANVRFWGSQKDGTVRSTMLKRETFTIETIYVPVKRRRTLDPKRVEEIAQSMLVDGQTTPILVRPDGARFVLVEGLHRLEAAKALGEQTIVGFRVAARKH
jgi:sulfiredoxin